MLGVILWRTNIIHSIKPRQIGLLSLSTLLCVGCVEFGVRYWLHYLASEEQRRAYCLYTDIEPQDWQWSPHHYLNYFPTPGFQRGLTQHNSQGFRGEEIETPKPPGVFRIAILGGSTTYTIAVKDNSRTFPAQLQSLLNTGFDQAKIEVINAGVGGYNSWESLINLQFRVLDLQPNLIIVYHGTNDVHTRLVPSESYRRDNSGHRRQWHYPRIPPVEYCACLRVILRKSGWTSQVGLETLVNTKVSLPASDAAIIARLDQNPPTYFERNLENMVGLARQADIKVLLATWAHSPHLDDYASTAGYQYGFRQNNDAMLRVAQKTGCDIFDFAAVMPVETKFWHDGRHVNELGALRKAELFADFLDKHILPKPFPPEHDSQSPVKNP